jgi:hypothetical protein
MSLRAKDLRKITEPTDARTLRQQDNYAQSYWSNRNALKNMQEVKPGSFIYEVKHSLSGGFCEEIINAFEEHQDLQGPGMVGSTTNLDMKRSMDITLNDDVLRHSVWRRIDKQLIKQIRKDSKPLWQLFPDFQRLNLELECFQVQKTFPGVLGFNWHDDGGYGAIPEREWAIIWYLNDVAEGGTTDFLYHDVQVRPEQGRLVLFPCSWMHIHKAQPPCNHKYIITSFFSRKSR